MKTLFKLLLGLTVIGAIVGLVIYLLNRENFADDFEDFEDDDIFDDDYVEIKLPDADDAKKAAKDVKEDVKDAAKDAKEDAKDAAKDAKEEAKDLKDKVVDKAKDLKDTVKDKVDDAKEAVADKMKEIKNKNDK